MLDVPIQEFIDLAAVLIRHLAEAKQRSNFFQRHVERPAVPDEGQPLQMGRRIGAITVGRAGRRRQQLRLLVVTDGFDIHPGGLAEFSDAHGGSFHRPILST